jgi:predicted RNA-binding Zn ribbon-like protein
MTGPARSGELFTFTAGRLCLDFANTVRARPLSDRIESINTYEDLLSWARAAAILTLEEVAGLRRDAERTPRAAAQALARALSVREAVYGVVSSHAAALPVPEGNLRTLNIAIGRAMSQSGLVMSGGGFEWGWPGVTPDLDRVSWLVARSAAELLTSPYLTVVRECEGYDCGWLFIDTTKNHNRRWCDMSTCGNRAKGRRHYARRRRAARGQEPGTEGHP